MNNEGKGDQGLTELAENREANAAETIFFAVVVLRYRHYTTHHSLRQNIATLLSFHSDRAVASDASCLPEGSSLEKRTSFFWPA